MVREIPQNMVNGFIDDALAVVARENGKAAISLVKRELSNWKGFGSQDDFEDTLVANGFTLERECKPNGDVRRTYVTV